MNLTKDEVLKLAKECNALEHFEIYGNEGAAQYDADMSVLLAFANAIADAQLEKDAKICEEHAADYACVGIAMYDQMETGARGCAEAIRADKE